jgi:hypothetical protein
VALAASARSIIDESSRNIEALINLPFGIFSQNEIIPKMFEHQDNLIGEPVCCLFLLTHATRGFHPDYLQNTDIEMWFHILRFGGLAYDAEPLVAFRRHPDQNTNINNRSGLSLEEHFRLLLQEASKAYCGRRARQAVALWTWGMLPHLPKSSSLNLMKSMQRLRSQLGYFRFWLAATGHLFRRLAGRWGRSIRKRLGQLNARS